MCRIPSRNAEFRQTLLENAVLRATQSPYAVRLLGGIRRGRMDARGVLVRTLGCYGETAAWYDAPSQLSAVTHDLGLSFASTAHAAGVDCDMDLSNVIHLVPNPL